VCVLLVPHPARRNIEQLLRNAGIKAEWAAPPSAQEIRARDQERLVCEIAEMAADPAEDDLLAARALLTERTPAEVAAALVRIHRSRLPAPEELTIAPPPRAPVPRDRGDRGDRPEGPARPFSPIGDVVWFRLNVGRANNADPRWLIPLLCRRGQVTKAVIGKIRIGVRETHFEIAADAAERFAMAARKPDPKDRQVRIEPLPDGHRA
jgi:ATP-dependent RNA helicase DeaD